MGDSTKIEWADKTWSPWTGCQAVSAACDFCYAQALDTQFGKGDRWGPHGVRARTSVSYWQRAHVWNRSAALNERRYKIFPSMCDPFDTHHTIQPEWRSEFWQTIRATPHLDWLLLTKRPQNILAMLPVDWGIGYPNVWLGTTVENRREADRRIPHLLRAPARLRFLSCEPLLEPLDIRSAAIHWVIAGGESGPNARPTHPDWLRGLRDQCEMMKVPFFFKQWGEWSPVGTVDRGANTIECEYGYERLGKVRAGRVLDGFEHDAFPRPYA